MIFPFRHEKSTSFEMLLYEFNLHSRNPVPDFPRQFVHLFHLGIVLQIRNAGHCDLYAVQPVRREIPPGLCGVHCKAANVSGIQKFFHDVQPIADRNSKALRMYRVQRYLCSAFLAFIQFCENRIYKLEVIVFCHGVPRLFLFILLFSRSQKHGLPHSKTFHLHRLLIPGCLFVQGHFPNCRYRKYHTLKQCFFHNKDT
nr:MAG TPA_asm: hypothetical protein [Caudoviricetes sp.]